jgi:hypothetical protein
MARHLHPDVQLVTPLEHLTGKEAVLLAAQRLLPFVKSVKVRTAFGSRDQAMLAYDMHFAAPIGVCRAAALMTFKDGPIVRNEIFFDTRPFNKE